MATNPHSLKNILSSRLITMAFQTFDKATLAVVVGAWTMAFFIMLFALYTAHLSVVVKADLAAAEAMEPLLPKIEKKPANIVEVQALADRLQKRFPDIKIAMSRNQSLSISASDGVHFRTWLTALSYIDTVSPQYRWTLDEFCVGMKCAVGSADPMRATLIPEKISFGFPAPKKKETTAKASPVHK